MERLGTATVPSSSEVRRDHVQVVSLEPELKLIQDEQ